MGLVESRCLCGRDAGPQCILGGQRWASRQGLHSVKPLSANRPSPQPLSPGGIIWSRSHQEACDTSWLLDPVQGLLQAAQGAWPGHVASSGAIAALPQATCCRAHAKHPHTSAPAGPYTSGPASLPASVHSSPLLLLTAQWPLALRQPRPIRLISTPERSLKTCHCDLSPCSSGLGSSGTEAMFLKAQLPAPALPPLGTQ